jgi:protein-S-isoprenylcysteine O-methyltransferase Ste14
MRTPFLQKGGLWVLAQIALLLAIVIFGVANQPAAKSPASRLAGAVFLFAAAVCGLAGVRALGRNLTPFPKPPEQAQFIRHGIYGLIRHPLYTAVLCGAVGFSLFRQSWPALLVTPVLAAFLDAKAKREEIWLRARFPAYAAYARQVRRFLPWIY